MWKALLLLTLAPLLGGCASWTAVQRDASWTLYVKDGEQVDFERFGAALGPAVEAVEERMGAFARPVRVHVLDPQSKQEAPPGGPAAGELQVVPDIGPARVRAYHVKGGALFQPSGVFLGTCDVGTVVHELVHARIADLGRKLPLWFEEGVASLWGDGIEFEGRWVVDGLACWPMRELRDLKCTDAELERWLGLQASDEYDSRDNLVAHFLGWAIVFDLAREFPDDNWEEWLARFEREAAREGRVAVARRHMGRTLERGTERVWLDRLGSTEPGVRAAVAKGLWKLRNPEVVDRMLAALERETHPEVRIALALNILLSSGETRMGRTRWGRISNLAFPTLREAKLPVEREQKALEDMYQSMRRWDSRSSRSTQSALEDLARFWEE